jgi:hypothetical protein
MKAEILNGLGVLARRAGNQFSRLHLWLYGVSGTLDAMADSAGYWDRHSACICRVVDDPQCAVHAD